MVSKLKEIDLKLYVKPRIEGKRPSGSLPSSVYRSVWHTALATTFMRTSPGPGAATRTLRISSLFTSIATMASHSMSWPWPALAL